MPDRNRSHSEEYKWPALQQIAAGGGFLNSLIITKRMRLGPSERVTIEDDLNDG